MKTVFLDRDGVINRYPGDKKYVTCLKSFRFLPKVKSAIANLHKKGFKIFVVSNQAGVSKGFYSRRTLNSITTYMLTQIRKSGGDIDAVYYCTHLKKANCSCRKPKPGLLSMAKKEHPGIKLKGSFFIGDTIRDVLTAKSAGCRSILVFSGKEKPPNRKYWKAQPNFVFASLREAADFILSQK